MIAATAFAAERPSPDGIKLFDERIDERGVVGQDAVLKVALAFGLRAHACTGEVRRAEVRLDAIHDDAFEMHTRTKHPLHSSPKSRITVEVVPPVWPRIFRMNEPNLNPLLHHPVQHLQKWHHIPPAGINIHVLDVGSSNPQPLLHLRHNPADDRLVDGAIGKEGCFSAD